VQQAALILGLIGGLIGLGASYLSLIGLRTLKAIADVEINNGAISYGVAEFLTWFTVVCFGVAIVAASLVSAKPKLVGWVMILTALGVLLIGNITEMTMISAVFIAVGGIFAVRSRKSIKENIDNEEGLSLRSLFSAWWRANKRD